MTRRPLSLPAVALLALGFAAAADAADPKLRVIVPRGVQRGAEVEVKFTGDRLADAQEVLFYGPGVTATKVEPEANGKAVKVTLKVAADCPLGEHVAQLRCATGLSEFRTFYVGALPEIAEQEPNNEFATPQPVPLNVTVTGVSDREDVDYFIVEARKGQRINAEIEGLRLGTDINTLYDPYVAILDADRFEMAVADDTPLVHQDAVASIVAPEDGRYVIQVRDSAYRGSGNCYYRLHVGEFPRPLAVYPAGGEAGKEVELTFIGDPAGPFKQKVTPSADGFALHPEQGGRIAPSANPFRVSPFGNVLEAEPNDTRQTATAASLPNAFNGVLEKEGDVDFFKFSAKKGQSFRVECYARRLRTPVDSVVDLYGPKGNRIGGNDDDRGSPDSGFDASIPEDGEYTVSVRDHLRRGGPEYVYRIEIAPPTPGLTLSIPRVSRYEQDRQRIVVPKGGRFATVINGSRRGIGGEIVLEADRLPPGVTMSFDAMADGGASMPVLFEAASDAPVGGFLVDLKGFRKDGPKDQFGRFENTADLIRYQNDQMLWTRSVDRLAVAVVEKVPFSVEIVEPTVPLVRNGTLNIKVVAKREEGFTKPIRVEFPFRPPGVGALPNMDIKEGQTEVLYTLNGDANAKIADWKVFAVASADVGGTAIVGSPLTPLKVADNYLAMTLDRAAAPQGQPVEIFAKVEVKTPFEGKAKAELLGLPNKVTAEPVEITKDTTEVRFKLQIAPDSPVGRHQNLFCQVTLPQNGGEMIHRAGQVELRIDPPPKQPEKKPEPKPEEKKAAEKKPEPQKPAEKPLSRLEQLRLEAKERLEGK